MSSIDILPETTPGYDPDVEIPAKVALHRYGIQGQDFYGAIQEGRVGSRTVQRKDNGNPVVLVVVDDVERLADPKRRLGFRFGARPKSLQCVDCGAEPMCSFTNEDKTETLCAFCYEGKKRPVNAGQEFTFRRREPAND